MPAPVNVVWRPNDGPQRQFLTLGCYESLYGGAAGGGKSEAILAGALRFAHLPDYTGIIFRRTFADLKRYLIDRSKQLYPLIFPGCRYNGADYVWRFPSGARVLFGHMEHEDAKFGHQGAQYQFVGFDELTHFTETQYQFLLSRLRSAKGIPSRARSTTNPGGPGHKWVFSRWGAWLDPNPALAVKAKPGEVLYYLNEMAGERYVAKGTLDADGERALSRVFVPARLEDNPMLMKNDPGYRGRLMGMDAVTREQLLNGNWTITAAAGILFKREMFGDFLQAKPADCVWIRYWDRASTKPSKDSPDPDWTRGGLYGLTKDGKFIVADMVSCQDRPGEVKKLIKATAQKDGRNVIVGLEQDPGAAGEFEIEEYIRFLAGYDARPFPQTKAKDVRARPVSAQASVGNVKLIAGEWNDSFIEELEHFPSKGWHDDQVDTLSGAYLALVDQPPDTVAQNWLKASSRMGSLFNRRR